MPYYKLVRRYLCSELVPLRVNSREFFVNLEEIWQSGAVLESEEPVPEGARFEIRHDAVFFAGEVIRVERHQFGWRIEVRFSPLTFWNPEEFRPLHMLAV